MVSARSRNPTDSALFQSDRKNCQDGGLSCSPCCLQSPALQSQGVSACTPLSKTCIHMQIHKYIHPHTCTCVFIYMHIYIYIYMVFVHLYTHMYGPSSLKVFRGPRDRKGTNPRLEQANSTPRRDVSATRRERGARANALEAPTRRGQDPAL